LIGRIAREALNKDSKTLQPSDLTKSPAPTIGELLRAFYDEPHGRRARLEQWRDDIFIPQMPAPQCPQRSASRRSVPLISPTRHNILRPTGKIVE
jgi:hypothetical protein